MVCMKERLFSIYPIKYKVVWCMYLKTNILMGHKEKQYKNTPYNLNPISNVLGDGA